MEKQRLWTVSHSFTSCQALETARVSGRVPQGVYTSNVCACLWPSQCHLSFESEPASDVRLASSASANLTAL